jgi:nucleoside-diphosphate-sugar epimerase
MKKALVTGGAGFIGFNLSRRLLDEGYQVIAVDNFITSSTQNINILNTYHGFTFINHDINNPFTAELEKACRDVETIYHLACPTGVPNLGPLAEEMLLTSSVGTRNVLELARFTGASFLFTSSSEVYGNPGVFPQAEAYEGNVSPVGIRSPYEEGKRFAEALIAMYVRKYGVDAKIVRVFNTYGIGMSLDDTRVIPRFLRLLKDRKPIEVHGSGKQTRTFCFADDLVDGLIIAERTGERGEVYNLGSDREITILSLAEMIQSVSNIKSEIVFTSGVSYDHDRRLPLLDKIKQLGWSEKTALESGLLKTIHYIAL